MTPEHEALKFFEVYRHACKTRDPIVASVVDEADKIFRAVNVAPQVDLKMNEVLAGALIELVQQTRHEAQAESEENTRSLIKATRTVVANAVRKMADQIEKE